MLMNDYVNIVFNLIDYKYVSGEDFLFSMELAFVTC